MSRCISRKVYVAHKISCLSLKIHLGTHVQFIRWCVRYTGSFRKFKSGIFQLLLLFVVCKLCTSKMPDVGIILCGNEWQKKKKNRWATAANRIPISTISTGFGESPSMWWSRHSVITLAGIAQTYQFYFRLTVFYEKNSVIGSVQKYSAKVTDEKDTKLV